VSRVLVTVPGLERSTGRSISASSLWSDGSMDASALLIDTFGRIPDLARSALQGLELNQVVTPPTEGSNPIGWLIWHLARVQDAQIAPLMGLPQLWETEPWAARFGLKPDPSNSGYGHSPKDVAAVRPESIEALLAYLDAVHQRNQGYLVTVSSDELNRVIDERWDPPVTMGTRLISIAVDCLEHAGQAAYVRGLLKD